MYKSITNENPQKQVLSKNLKEIGKLVTEEDRLKAALDLEKNYVTVQRYLYGKVAKVSFGEKLLKYMKVRIAEREKAIA